MRSSAVRIMRCLVWFGLAASIAFAQGAAIGDEVQPAAVAGNKGTTETVTEAKKADAKAEPFKPPPGFRTKKRGSLVLYCIQDSTVGTRFKTEKCFDEAQMHDYLIAREENKRDMERVRSTCSSGVAGGPCSHP